MVKHSSQSQPNPVTDLIIRHPQNTIKILLNDFTRIGGGRGEWGARRGVHRSGVDAVAGGAAVDDDLGGVVGPLAEGHPEAARPGAGHAVVGEQEHLRDL